MSPGHNEMKHYTQGFPRASGDEPAPGPTSYAGNLFSPRERG